MALIRGPVVLALAVLQAAAPGGVTIDHTAVECVVAERAPALSACFTPAEDVVRARVYYRLGERPWQFGALTPEGSCFGAVLERPQRRDDALRYYIEVVDGSTRATRSPEHRARVVADAKSCGGGVVAGVSDQAPAMKAAGGGRRIWPIAAVGAGVAGVAVAVAGGGGSNPGPSNTVAATTPPSSAVGGGTDTTAPTSSTVPPSSSTPGGGGNSTTTTSTAPTTLPGATPTPGGPTTLPATATPTPPAAATPTPTPSPTATPVSCNYSLTPPEATFLLLGGNGMCFVSVTPNSCAYHVTSDQSWIVIQGGGFGTGDATVSYQVQGLAVGSRNGNLVLQENPNERCHVTQAAFGRPEQGGGLPSSSELDVAGGALQLVWNGAAVRYLREGASVGDAPVVAGLNRIEALLVTSAGRPGTWRFTAPTSVRPGSLRALAGAVAAVDSGSISFHLKGVPGERLVLVFETEP